MTLFFEDLLISPILQYALVGGLLASVACGMIGSFVVVRRASYIAGAIAHAVLGGMGIAYYVQHVHGVSWMTPIVGATIAAILISILISLVTLYSRERQDTVLSAVWAIGMAVGISFMAATPGYQQDLMSYLLGRITMVGPSDLWQMGVLDCLILLVVVLFYDKFLVISFQPELARLRGVRVGLYQTLLIILTSLTVVLLCQIVGLIMMIALLTLPAATAFQFAGRLWKAMVLTAILCMLLTTGGLAISYAPGWPTGATVIELAGAVYLLVLAGKWVYKKNASKHKHG